MLRLTHPDVLFPFQRLDSLLEGARAAGRILLGGEVNRDERRIAPTVIRVENRQDPLMADEVFGPLLPLLDLGDLDSTLAEIRRGPEPLARYVFGGSDEQQPVQASNNGSQQPPSSPHTSHSRD